ncbi:maker698 [Drosophila busckii]|uniref:Maker698 n=1 Tax=Drosophila busckii TaxID=30019 RepID=A0A0M4EJ16_DROBS|nr:uncharacterized protein LOC108599713 [Drosophila busckii]ALC43951.1 maker698 [Drosophila busckii]
MSRLVLTLLLCNLLICNLHAEREELTTISATVPTTVQATSSSSSTTTETATTTTTEQSVKLLGYPKDDWPKPVKVAMEYTLTPFVYVSSWVTKTVKNIYA